MKRGKVLVFIFWMLLAFILIINAVSAGPISDVLTNVGTEMKPVLAMLFGTTDYVLEQLLFGLILIAFIYMALSQVEVLTDKGWIIWLISVSASILGVRYIASNNFVTDLLFPQGVLAVALLTIIPFAVYFWFVEYGLEGPKNRVLRKIAWVAFAAVFVFLWVKQFYVPEHPSAALVALIGGIGGSVQVPSEIRGFGYLYLLVAFGSLALLLGDGTIQGALAKSKTRAHIDVMKEQEISRIRKRMRRNVDEMEAEQAIAANKELEKELEKWLKR